MSFHISYVSLGASNTLFFSHNVTLLLQYSASSASKIIRRKYKNNFEHLLSFNVKKLSPANAGGLHPTVKDRDIPPPVFAGLSFAVWRKR